MFGYTNVLTIHIDEKVPIRNNWRVIIIPNQYNVMPLWAIMNKW